MTIHKNGKYWARLAITAITSLALAASGAVIGVSHRQAMNYLHPVRNVPTGDFLRENGIDFQDVELVTSDGVRLSAWYTPPHNGVVILLAHGYGLHRMEDFHTLFAGHGYGVMAWDFRAHGTSGGNFCSLGYYEVLDVKAALDYVLAQPNVAHIGGWGGSMGAVTMIRAASQYPQIEALVADSSFSTLEEEMDLRIPYPVLRPLIRFFAEQESGVDIAKVRPVDDIVHISPRPVLIIQGMSDGMIPPDSAQRLYDASGDPHGLWMEPGVPHLGMYSQYETGYTERVIGFFDNYLLDK